MNTEFEVSMARSGLSFARNENGAYIDNATHYAFKGFKAGRTGWTPIDEAAKDGQEVDIWHPETGRITDCQWVENGKFFWQEYTDSRIHGATHYMPIADAPEVG